MINKELLDKFFFEIKDNKFIENLDSLGYQIFDRKVRELAYKFVIIANDHTTFTRKTNYLCGKSTWAFYNNNKSPSESFIYKVDFGDSSTEEKRLARDPLEDLFNFNFTSLIFEKNIFGFTTGKIKKSYHFEPFSEFYYVDLPDLSSYTDRRYNRHEEFRKAISDDLANLNKFDSDFFDKILSELLILLEEVNIEMEIERTKLLEEVQDSILFIDKDNDGKVDLIDDISFNDLLLKHQQYISEIDIVYMQKFVKISIYLKTKRENIQKIFNSIKKSKDIKESNELLKLLKNQIHIYELLLFHSISMLMSLVKRDFITFFEIYEKFDQLDIFNSKWENDISKKLTRIQKGLRDLMYSLNQMEASIVNSLGNLSYTNQISFLELQDTISSELSTINSSIKFNNLLTGIQAYQLYRINKNTKSIKE